MTIFGGYAAGLKTGMTIPYAGNDALDGYLVCDGSAISRELYPELFAVIGTIYGEGDGETTFNIPNFIDRTFWGGTTPKAYLGAQLPNITGYIDGCSRNGVASGAFYIGSGGRASGQGSYRDNSDVNFSATRSSDIYKDNARVRPDSVQMRILIKY